MRLRPSRAGYPVEPRGGPKIGRGDDAVGNPHRAQNSQFELFEFII